MRARSTAASVCPARTSTPPSRARRGNVCPGRARSSGRVFGSTAASTVTARSAAEIPGVVRRLASIDPVKEVPNVAPFFGVNGRQCGVTLLEQPSVHVVIVAPHTSEPLEQTHAVLASTSASPDEASTDPLPVSPQPESTPTWLPGSDDQAQALVQQADAALYQAKRAGRERVMAHEPPPSEATEAPTEQAQLSVAA